MEKLVIKNTNNKKINIIKNITDNWYYNLYEKYNKENNKDNNLKKLVDYFYKSIRKKLNIKLNSKLYKVIDTKIIQIIYKKIIEKNIIVSSKNPITENKLKNINEINKKTISSNDIESCNILLENIDVSNSNEIIINKKNSTTKKKNSKNKKSKNNKKKKKLKKLFINNYEDFERIEDFIDDDFSDFRFFIEDLDNLKINYLKCFNLYIENIKKKNLKYRLIDINFSKKCLKYIKKKLNNIFTEEIKK